ncbi:hypothetical protein Ddye_001878 [Dipteronia dyeriana]|uniref:Reverse transcriptase zinc-binding domain-containing protein n=1 Tax=Dipteronia dyeriana TaxID=168575 RepID=A0AAD9XPG4_9ROSI|nr:hypothetical protein Ddye_001878 [Dipteronia dyeriana]
MWSWRVGDGDNIGFWTDDWVPKLGRLYGFATSPSLMTESMRKASRGLTSKITCNRCKEECEDSEHVFRDCTESVGIWEDIRKGVTKNGLFTSDWQDWLCQNLNCSKLIMGKYSNYVLFVVALWFIWKWRYECVFNPHFKIFTCPGKIVLKYVEAWWNANNDMDKIGSAEDLLIYVEPSISGLG